MNNINRGLLILLLAGFLSSEVVAQQNGTGRGQQNQGAGRSAESQRSIKSDRQSGRRALAGALSEHERSELRLMREEEKLARDVYLGLGQKWNARVFSNIAQAESRHMQAVAGLLARYRIADPVADDTPGVFTDARFQQLYKSLYQTGSRTMVDAVKVGLKIEEMDIVDLQRAIQTTNNNDIQQVLENLQRGSRNHLRAFAAQLQRLGGSYHPTHLSQEEFDQIAQGVVERGGPQVQPGFGNGRGGQKNRTNGRGRGKGRG